MRKHGQKGADPRSKHMYDHGIRALNRLHAQGLITLTIAGKGYGFALVAAQTISKVFLNYFDFLDCVCFLCRYSDAARVWRAGAWTIPASPAQLRAGVDSHTSQTHQDTHPESKQSKKPIEIAKTIVL